MQNKIIYADFATKNLGVFKQGLNSSISKLLYGGSADSKLEEEQVIVNLVDKILTSVHSRVDMINCFLSHRGDLLKNELNNIGINDEILNDIGYLNASKFSGVYNPMLLSKIFQNLYDVAKTLNEQGLIAQNDFNDILLYTVPCEHAFAYAWYGIDEVNQAYRKLTKKEEVKTAMKVA